jgi:hypothetical protein
VNLNLTFVRSSQNRFEYIYREELDEQPAEVVGTVRLQKLAVGHHPPHRIRVTLCAEDA